MSSVWLRKRFSDSNHLVHKVYRDLQIIFDPVHMNLINKNAKKFYSANSENLNYSNI